MSYKFGLTAPDDNQLFIIRKDVSGGINTRMHASELSENQITVLENTDIGTPGKRGKRPGSVITASLATMSPICLHNFEVQGGTDQLLMYETNNLRSWVGGSTWSTLLSSLASVTTCGMVSAKQSGIVPDDVTLFNNKTNMYVLRNATYRQILSGASGVSYCMQPTDVMCWYGNRVWSLYNDQLEYSDAYPSDYGQAFGNVKYRIPVGEERALVPTRDMGIIVFGKSEIWALAPSAVPVATDKPEPIVTNMGAVSKRGIVNAGDDIYFFAQDGLRSLKRTVQDKLQMGASYPISYMLKDEFEEIEWAYIDRLCMEYFDNKIFITVPTSVSTYKTWVYYPAGNSFTILTGWNPRSYGKYKINGEEHLYYGGNNSHGVYRGWYGYTDEGSTITNGTAISTLEEGREEDFGQPLIKKSGGEIEIEASAVGGAYDYTIYARPDGGAYVELGTMSLQSDSAPTLPVDLPFNLSDSYIVREKLPLDILGSFRTLQYKLENNDSNSEDLAVYSVNMVTFPEAYEND